jgi:hypothetical protein
MDSDYDMNNFWTEITKVSSFKTTEAAKDHVNAIAKRFHFAVRIADSGKQRALTLVCSRSGQMKASGDPRRRSTNRSCTNFG